MENTHFEQLKERLLNDSIFIGKLSGMMRGDHKSVSQQKFGLEELIEQVRQLLNQLIRQQLQNQLKQIIEDNNRILMEIKENMSQQHLQKPVHEIEDVPFSEVHKLMNEQKKKIPFPEQINDASLDKSISAFVELKVQTIEERVISIDKRMKNMQQKYETNLKSIWNVLSITEGAIFDHLKEVKAKQKICIEKSLTEQEPQSQKKSFFGFFKSSK